MVLNTKSIKGNRSKMEEDQMQSKAGKKRAMEESDDKSEEDSDEEVDMEMLKKLSKKMKPNSQESDEEDDSEDVEDDDDDEEEDDDDEEDDEVEEEQKPKNKISSIPVKNNKAVKKSADTKIEAKKSNGHVQLKPEVVQVNANAVMIGNLNKSVSPIGLNSFISSKSGLNDLDCFVSYKPSAVVITKSPEDAKKLMESCQSTMFLGCEMQLCQLSSGLIPKKNIKNDKDITPSELILVYTLRGFVDHAALKEMFPNATDVHKGGNGVYVQFKTLKESQDAFISLGKNRKVKGVDVYVKYVKNSSNARSFTGNETKLMLYNLPHDITMSKLEELVPKASFLHYNPVAQGSYIVEFSNSSDCKEAGSRLDKYQLDGRPIRLSYSAPNVWELRLNVARFVNDAKAVLNTEFPDMVSYKVMTNSKKFKMDSRSPAFILTFQSRETWLRALDKVSKMKNLAGVPITIPNLGSSNKQVQKPKIPEVKEKKVQEKKKLPEKKTISKPVQPGSDAESDGDEPMDEDEDSEEENDSEQEEDSGEENDSEEENNSDDDVDEDDDEEEIKPKNTQQMNPKLSPRDNKFQNKPRGAGFGNRGNNRGRGGFGNRGNNRGGGFNNRGGNRGRGNFRGGRK